MKSPKEWWEIWMTRQEELPKNDEWSLPEETLAFNKGFWHFLEDVQKDAMAEQRERDAGICEEEVIHRAHEGDTLLYVAERIREQK